MNRFLLPLSVSVALCLAISTDVAAKTLVLKNAFVVDVEKGVAAKKDLFVKDGKVSFDAASASLNDADVRDLSGKWIIPGLIDLHVHCQMNPLPDGGSEELDGHKTAKLMMKAGVCAYLDLAQSDFGKLFRERDEQRKNHAAYSDEADIYCAGTAFGRWNMSAPDKAHEVLSAYVTKYKPDVIKVIYGKDSCPTETVVAALKASDKLGVKSVVHIGSWQHAADAIEAGATVVTHFFDDEVIPASLLKLWAEKRTISIPTMAVQCDLANFVDHPNLLLSPLLKSLESESSINTYKNEKKFSAYAKKTLQWQREDINNDLTTLKKMHRAHIPILAGSDTGNQGTFQGFSLHRELVLLQQGGLTPAEALACGTTEAAKFLNRTSGVNSGDLANLVILSADPLKDVANTQKIMGVVHDGVWLSR